MSLIIIIMTHALEGEKITRTENKIIILRAVGLM